MSFQKSLQVIRIQALSIFTLSIIVSLFATSSLVSLDRSPWLGNVYEFEGQISEERTSSNTINTTHGDKSKHLHNNITRANLRLTSSPELSEEIELSFNEMQQRSYGFDVMKASLRKLWLNDVTGDRVSLTTGLVFSLANGSHLHNLSSQNHGDFEGEVNFAIGKEFGFKENSYFKTWALGLVGAANQGSPWIGGELHLQYVAREVHFIDLFLKAEKGFGEKKLHPHTSFKSWGQMDYQYEDLGLGYTYRKEALGSIYAQVARRLHAHFCPKNTLSLEIGIIVPFSF